MSPKELGPEFSYDLSELRRVDPNLVHYEEAAGVPTGLDEPRGIAVGPQDRLYVAGDKTVRAFDRDGKPVAEFKTGDEPQCLTVGEGGQVLVAMQNHVEVFEEAGKRLAAWDAAGKDAVLTCVAATDADVFVADANGPVVLRYDPGAGRVVGRIDGRVPCDTAAKDAGDAGFIVPSPYLDVAVAGKDRLWIVNPGRRRVESYTFDGRILAHWGKASPKIEGFCGCCNPTHIALLPDGRLVTSEKGLPRVKVYSTAGELESVVAPPAAFADAAAGLDVAADSQGRVYVLDPLARKVRVFVRKKSAAAMEPK